MAEPYTDDEVMVWGLHDGLPADLLEDFQEQTGVTFPLVVDENSTVYDLGFPPGVDDFYPFPKDVIVGKDLTIRMIRHSFNADEVDDLIQELLAE